MANFIRDRRDWILKQYETRTTEDIAKQLDVNERTLRSAIWRWQQQGYAPKKNTPGENLDQDREIITELSSGGMAPCMIARKWECSTALIRNKLREWGLLNADVKLDDCKDRVVRMLNVTLPRDIAAAVGVNERSLRKAMVRWGIYYKRKYKGGKYHYENCKGSCGVCEKKETTAPLE